ncbi:hypothetical protein CLU79DRAFT_708984 [Phycomyces nitens]|nr:hypothetical protein CLU79DRAFT_708984 [Phycomyces nitens]
MKSYSYEVGPEQPNGGRIRRSTNAVDGLVRGPDKNVHTLYDVLQYAVKKYGDADAFGYRKLENIIEEEKQVTKFVDGVETKETKVWKYFQYSGYYYMSYKEASRKAHDIGAGLYYLGMREGSKIEIFAPTSLNWIVASQSAFTQNMSIVTAYDTLGEDGLLHSMNETEVQAIYTSAELLGTVAKVAAKCPSLRIIMYSGEPTPEAIEKAKVGSVQEILSMDEIAAFGRANPREAHPPEPEDICCIMYTSGSTGNPKGVMLSHKNIAASVGSTHEQLKDYVSPRDSMMAYLPLAHVFEFVTEHTCIFWGITLGYGSPRTLTDASVRNCKGDIKEFRPTLMTGVPAVWESIRKGVLAKINESSPNAQKVFHKAFAAKAWLQERRYPTYLLDTAVFSKIKEQVGGRLRVAISGGAPMSIETQRFLSVTVCPVLAGYGMTESCSMTTLMVPELYSLGNVGGPQPCAEIKLVDVPDAGYFSTNTPKPQGEVWMRGPSVTKGYWKREDATREALNEDGWLQTGDIGEWNEDGSLSVIDRKKNLVKLSNGEYIALEKMESIYKSCLYVGNICICADSLLPRAIALVVPLEPAIRKMARQKGVETNDWEELCANETVKKTVLSALNAQAKVGGLKGAELLFDIHIVSDEWTIEAGLLTAAQKLKRQEIVKRYKAEIDEV